MIAIVTAILGAYAGAEGTSLAFRRVGIPLICGVYAFCVTGHLWAILPYLGWFGVLSLGYGKPDGTDAGSWLGRVFKRDMLIRGFLAVLFSLCMLLTVSDYHGWVLKSGLLILIWSIFGGDDIVKNEGTVRLFGKEVLIEDLILYGSLGGYAYWLIR